MRQKEQKTLDMGSAPLGQLMLHYAVPCIISLVVAALYNIVDQLFIANAAYLGSYGNAANTTVFPLVVICLAIAGMFGDGTNAHFTYCVGAGKSQQAEDSVGTSVVTIILIGILMALIYTIFRKPILTLFGASVNQETYVQAQEYLMYIAIGLPFYMLGQTMSPIICGDNSPNYAMVTMLIGCAINIVLDPVLIYVAKWGMKGAALATITGQIVTCILNASYLARMKNIHLSRRSFRIRLSALRHILPLGMTSFFSQLSIVLSMTCVNNVLNIYGAQDAIFAQEAYSHIPLAVVGIVFKFNQVIVSVAIGMSAGCVPIIGYNRGAGKFDRLLQLQNRLITCELVFGAVAMAVFELLPGQIANLFGAANESVYYKDYAISCIRIFMSTVMLTCVNKGIMIFLQGMGKAVQSTTVSILREIFGGVALPIIFAMIFGFNGIPFFMPAAEIITFVVAIIFLLLERREMKAEVEKTSVRTETVFSK